jgi:hypothetical protein
MGRDRTEVRFGLTLCRDHLRAALSQVDCSRLGYDLDARYRWERLFLRRYGGNGGVLV